jgi:hypothetical protein
VRLRAVLLGAVLLAGCGASEQRAAAPTPSATPTPTPSAPPAQTVRFKAADGQPVTAQYTPAGDRAPAVVLLHEIRGGPDQWDPLVPLLHEAGFATLAYSSRVSPL